MTETAVRRRAGIRPPAERPPRRASTDAGLATGWPEGFVSTPADRHAALLLAYMAGIAPLDLLALAHERESAGEVVRAVAAGRAGSDADRRIVAELAEQPVERAIRDTGVRPVLPGDDEYVPSLLDAADPPVALFLRGTPLVEERHAVAVVGARGCSPYGREVAEAIGGGLGAAGVTVVSGAARGIDAAAHRGALAARGRTVAVLGCGPDIAFPASNRALIERIAREGTVVSEYPPGTPPQPFRFPARNRIVAALARSVVVVEGAPGSGSTITVDHAQDLGREVLVVPGPVTSPLSAVPLELLRGGAVPVRGAEDVLEELGMTPQAPRGPALALPLADAAVLGALGGTAEAPEALAARAGIALPETLSALLRLEVAGYVRRVGGRFERTLLAGR